MGLQGGLELVAVAARKRKRGVDMATMPEHPHSPDQRDLALDAAMAALPVKLRSVVVLHYYLDLSIADTATTSASPREPSRGVCGVRSMRSPRHRRTDMGIDDELRERLQSAGTRITIEPVDVDDVHARAGQRRRRATIGTALASIFIVAGGLAGYSALTDGGDEKA